MVVIDDQMPTNSFLSTNSMNRCRHGATSCTCNSHMTFFDQFTLLANDASKGLTRTCTLGVSSLTVVVTKQSLLEEMQASLLNCKRNSDASITPLNSLQTPYVWMRTPLIIQTQGNLWVGNSCTGKSSSLQLSSLRISRLTNVSWLSG